MPVDRNLLLAFQYLVSLLTFGCIPELFADQVQQDGLLQGPVGDEWRRRIDSFDPSGSFLSGMMFPTTSCSFIISFLAELDDLLGQLQEAVHSNSQDLDTVRFICESLVPLQCSLSRMTDLLLWFTAGPPSLRRQVESLF